MGRVDDRAPASGERAGEPRSRCEHRSHRAARGRTLVRRFLLPGGLAGAVIAAGCVADTSLFDQTLVAAQVVHDADGDPRAAPAAASSRADAEPIVLSDGGTVVLAGHVAGDEYDLFGFEGSARGDAWSIELPEVTPIGVVRVALFDEDMNLLARRILRRGNVLEHTVRADCAGVFVGCAADDGVAGGYELYVRREGGRAVPAPRRQVVWLNFAGGRNVSVHQRGPVSFPALDAADIDPNHSSSDTPTVKDAIVATIVRNYADYAVEVLTSDETGRPAEPHSVLHFGGSDAVLLGIADTVDAYNAEAQESAIVYVESFARYAPMRLRPEQLGAMIGNVASHELGHLLGLFHTVGADNVMDNKSGNAWDLVFARAFTPAAIDESVFPVGRADLPVLLEQAVGWRAVPLPVEVLEKADAAARSLSRLDLEANGLPVTPAGTACGVCGG